MSEVEGNNADATGTVANAEPKVDQITAVPKEEADETRRVSVKVKDPKRVAAGKALAERNRKAREALKEKEAAADATRRVAEEPSSSPIDGIVKAAAIVGAGFTLYHGYTVIKPYLNKPSAFDREKKEYYEEPEHVAPTKEPEEKNKVEMDME